MNHKKAVSPQTRASRTSSRTGRRLTAAQKQRRREAARRRRIRYLLLGLGLGLAACLLIFSIWKLVNIFTGYSAADKEYEDLRQYVLEEPVSPDEAETETVETEDGETTEQITVPMERIDLASLQQINSDAVGWIEIPGTVISYPLVHTSDNVYYLTHTFRKEESRSGSIFIEHANSSDFSDLHTIIYGHNMKNGSMFADLLNYESESYWDSHKTIQFDTLTESRVYEIAAVVKSNDVEELPFEFTTARDDGAEDVIENMESASLYDTGVDMAYGDDFLTLATCDYSVDDGRLVVMAKRIQ